MKMLTFLSTLLLSCALYAGHHGASHGKLNINTATAEQLDQRLKGVGSKTAAAIVEYRKEHGAFENAEDLMEVNGVGEKTIEKNQEIIDFSQPK